MTEDFKVRRALLSVYDKTGIVEFAKELESLGIEIISTGGTARLLKSEGVSVELISNLTGYPHMLDGRVKSLHPVIHAGILADRAKLSHMEELKKHNIGCIDMVVVNLYPFEMTISSPDVKLEDAIEQIDIGGVALIRSAAKNFKDVVVITNPAKYEFIQEELRKNDGMLTYEFRLRLAMEALKLTSHYDSVIHNYFKELTRPPSQEFPNEVTLHYVKVFDLRYGENPHQKAAFYKKPFVKVEQEEPSLVIAKQLHGKELSFNNLLDSNAALECLKEFTVPTAVIVKHNNPCGVGCGERIFEAYRRALETDPVSSFGSIVALNEGVDEDLAEELNNLFIEVIIAPNYTDSALVILKKKKNIRILYLPQLETWIKEQNWSSQKEYKHILDGLLVQDRDVVPLIDDKLQVVTKRNPSLEEWKGLKFAWKVVKHVKSNAIVIANSKETVGIGAGQMSRVDSVRLAINKANKPLEGTVLASDAFFPFRDNVDEIAKVGIKAVIQPGGSIRDKEVIEAADEYGIAMVFTGIRHFKH